MPLLFDYALTKHSDGVMTISLENPVNIAGWNIQATIMKRFGGVSGIATRSMASGYGNGVSGMTMVNSGLGIFSIQLRSADLSGFDYNAYAMTIERLDSGHRTMLCEGYLLSTP